MKCDKCLGIWFFRRSLFQVSMESGEPAPLKRKTVIVCRGCYHVQFEEDGEVGAVTSGAMPAQ